METASAVLGALICTNKHISLSSGCGGSHVHATAASHRDALTRSPQIRKLSCISHSHSHSHRTMVVCLPCGPEASSDPHGACRAITRGRAPTCSVLLASPAVERWLAGPCAAADSGSRRLPLARGPAALLPRPAALRLCQGRIKRPRVTYRCCSRVITDPLRAQASSSREILSRH